MTFCLASTVFQVHASVVPSRQYDPVYAVHRCLRAGYVLTYRRPSLWETALSMGKLTSMFLFPNPKSLQARSDSPCTSTLFQVQCKRFILEVRPITMLKCSLSQLPDCGRIAHVHPPGWLDLILDCAAQRHPGELEHLVGENKEMLCPVSQIHLFAGRAVKRERRKGIKFSLTANSLRRRRQRSRT